jgi:hypothetical protein
LIELKKPVSVVPIAVIEARIPMVMMVVIKAYSIAVAPPVSFAKHFREGLATSE